MYTNALGGLLAEIGEVRQGLRNCPIARYRPLDAILRSILGRGGGAAALEIRREPERNGDGERVHRTVHSAGSGHRRGRAAASAAVSGEYDGARCNDRGGRIDQVRFRQSSVNRPYGQCIAGSLL